MIYSFSLYGRVPSKKNSKSVTLEKGGGGKTKVKVRSSDLFRSWHTESLKQLGEVLSHLSGRKFEIIEHIDITIFFPDNRQADVSNKVESIMDLLVDFKILKDDSWQVVPSMSSRGCLRRGMGGADVAIIVNSIPEIEDDCDDLVDVDKQLLKDITNDIDF